MPQRRGRSFVLAIAFTVPAAITGALPSTAGFGHCGARLARMRRVAVPGRDVTVTVASADHFGFF